MLEILEAIIAAGGRPMFVGGCVRDLVLGLEPKDRDVEVYGIGADALITVLSQFGQVNAVGASFGILKLAYQGQDLDFSLPRRENKAGKGHKGFMVECDPTMTMRDAAARRDFTFNSLAQDPFTGEIFDPFDGISHLAHGIISATSPAFAEDPLRVLRAMQFAGRFSTPEKRFIVTPHTAAMCRELRSEYPTLAQERVWTEWQKWAEKSTLPSAGLNILRHTSWLALYPELAALLGVPQDPEWHPEGSAWAHTLHVVDAAAAIAARDGLTGDDRTVLVLAALCHDLGKPECTAMIDGRWRSPAHDTAGEAPTRAFLARIGAPMDADGHGYIVDRVVKLVTHHMDHLHPQTPRTVRRMAVALQPATVAELVRVIEADHSGRPPLPGGLPESAQQMAFIADQLAVGNAQPAPILLGRHLIANGDRPGPHFRHILDAAYEAQLDGSFSDLAGALEWLECR